MLRLIIIETNATEENNTYRFAVIKQDDTCMCSVFMPKIFSFYNINVGYNSVVLVATMHVIQWFAVGMVYNVDNISLQRYIIKRDWISMHLEC